MPCSPWDNATTCSLLQMWTETCLVLGSQEEVAPALHSDPSSLWLRYRIHGDPCAWKLQKWGTGCGSSGVYLVHAGYLHTVPLPYAESSGSEFPGLEVSQAPIPS